MSSKVSKERLKMVFAIILIVVAVYIILEELTDCMSAGHILFLIKGINLSLMASSVTRYE